MSNRPIGSIVEQTLLPLQMLLTSFRIDLGSSDHQDDPHFELPRLARRLARGCSGFAFLFVLMCFCAAVHAQSSSCDFSAGSYNPCNFSTAKIMSVIENPHSDLITVSSHRGLHALVDGSNPGVPENSLQAIGRAAQDGLEMIELDIKVTSDNQPAMSHDLNLGRETDYGYYIDQNTFDPFTLPGNFSNDQRNPLVSSLTMAYIQQRAGSVPAIQLRDTISLGVPSGGEEMSSLKQVLDYLTSHQIAMVLALDLRDAAAATAAWNVISSTNDYQGNSYARSTLFKIPGKAFLNGQNYTDTSLFKNAFSAGPGYTAVHFQPVYNTGDIAANLYGNEENIIAQLRAFENDPTIDVAAVEVQYKQSAGTLLSVLTAARTSPQKTGSETVSIFSPYVDYWSRNDPNHTLPLFYTTNGYCCVPLSTFYYNTPTIPIQPIMVNPAPPFSNPTQSNPNYDSSRPTDTADLRGSYDFVVGQGYNSVTRDDAPEFAAQLAAAGKRNISYMQGQADPHCNVGTGQYPGCDSEGTTVFTSCVAEGGTCSFAGVRVVAFGANGQYKYWTVTNTVACNDDTLGPDPIGGVQKACYYSPAIGDESDGSPDPSIYCTDEGGVCKYSSSNSENDTFAILQFGANTWSNILYDWHGSIACSTGAIDTPLGYGDPDPGVRKTCHYAQTKYSTGFAGAPAGYTLCSVEGQTCTFAGAAKIAFGANGNFSYRTFTASSPESSAGGAACNVSEFPGPDPAFGVAKACYYQYAVSVSATISSGNGGGGNNNPGTTSTCDIYASGGTPCVAAHSTVRALFAGYSGKLYQVKRASDGTTIDITTSPTSGIANAASQDSFCAGTTCAITIIYDQTSNHNDLPVTPGDSLATANALPITANGNKAYGLQVTPGVGYRNNATRSIATGASPEGMYMVTSGTYVNGSCCFDYGNAETNSQDNHEGHMDALNFGTFCEFPPCSGNGPWVEADLEDGQYMGNGNNPADVSMGYDFVTAMLKNNGTSTFALKGGNAQTGTLTAEYSGSLPTTKPGYIPMKLEGAIILGTGGDNSDRDMGAFFEGAMTSGYPTDATEAAVQANIVAAGYAGDSSGGSGGSGDSGSLDANEPPGPYTGPNDPGGPGPQDGFASPATLQPNDIMATKPALASFNGGLYVGFQGLNAGNDFYLTSSTTGSGFPVATRYTNIQMSSAPSMATFNNQLYLAFRGLNTDNDFYVTSSSDGINFPTATRYTNIQMGGAPALAEFNYQLCASFQANDPGHTLHVTCSSDGLNWPTAWQIPNVLIGSDPAMAAFNGKLYIAFRANDSSNDVWIASSSDGVNFSSQVLTGQTMGGYSTPALVVSNGVLYYIYGANDSDNEMLVSASTDGSTWQGPAAYLNDKMSPLGPGAAAFGNGISVGFQSNDSRNVLFVTNKVTEASSYTGPSDPGGHGPQDGFASPAAEQPNDVMATKPALAPFNGSLYVAFQGLNASNDLYVTSSLTGNNFPAATRYTNIQMSSAPAMATFNNQLYLAFRGLNASNDLYVTSSLPGSTFPAATRYTNIQMGGAPALAAFNNQLCAAFQANDPGHTLHVTCSSDGVNWPAATNIANVRIGSDPAIAAFNGKLYVAFRADDPSNDVWIASSSDGINFSSQVLAGQTMGGSSSPALAVSNCTLYYIYGANDQANEMLVLASRDGSTWQGPSAYLDVQMGPLGPGATAFGNGVSVGFQSNDSRNVLFMTNVDSGGGGCPAKVGTGTYLQNSTDYPRLVRLSHGSSSVNGQIIASTNGNIYRSTNGGISFTFLDTVPTISGSIENCCATLFELPQAVGNLQAGTLLFAGSYFVGTSMAIEVYTSTDQGQTWNYLGTPVSGGTTSPGHGLWEPQFEVANDGALVMFWSDETDSCCSQKLAQIRTYDGATWKNLSNTVASLIQSDRPGMVVVTKLPSGVFFMSYELCGPAACTVFYRTSTDGWDFGDSSNTGTKVQTASGQYFEHAPTNVWSSQGGILLIGQVMFESNGSQSAGNGETIFVNGSSDGSGPWLTIPAPIQIPNAYDNYCPNYSSALLPSADGGTILELASNYDTWGQCVSYYASEAPQ